MAGKNEFEVIHYDDTNYKFTVVSADASPLHLHQEIEILLLLHGDCRVQMAEEELLLNKGDFCIINSMKSHRNVSATLLSRFVLLELQIKPDFFTQYFSNMDTLEFPFMKINRESIGEVAYKNLLHQFLRMAQVYFARKPLFQLYTSGMINIFFYHLLRTVPYTEVSKNEQQASYQKTQRLRSLLKYIDEHYGEPLYLTDLAEQEGLSMSRLSHAFKESLGISFQEYVSQIRCRNARQLLLDTDMKLLDVCMTCGFSDPKYFKQDFTKIYHITPKEYRKRYQASSQKLTGASLLGGAGDTFDSVLTVFSNEDALVCVEYCIEEGLE